MIPKPLIRKIADELAEEKVGEQPDPEGGKPTRVVTLAAVTRAAFKRDCPPVELRNELITDEHVVDPSDELGFRRSKRAASRLVRLTSDMHEDIVRRLNWLILHSASATELVERFGEIDTIDHSRRDEAEHADAVWPTDYARNRWRAAARKVREFNEVREAILAKL